MKNKKKFPDFLAGILIGATIFFVYFFLSMYLVSCKSQHAGKTAVLVEESGEPDGEESAGYEEEPVGEIEDDSPAEPFSEASDMVVPLAQDQEIRRELPYRSSDRVTEEYISEVHMDTLSGQYEKPDPGPDFGSSEQGMPGGGATGSFSAEPFEGENGVLTIGDSELEEVAESNEGAQGFSPEQDFPIDGSESEELGFVRQESLADAGDLGGSSEGSGDFGTGSDLVREENLTESGIVDGGPNVSREDGFLDSMGGNAETNDGSSNPFSAGSSENSQFGANKSNRGSGRGLGSDQGIQEAKLFSFEPVESEGSVEKPVAEAKPVLEKKEDVSEEISATEKKINNFEKEFNDLEKGNISYKIPVDMQVGVEGTVEVKIAKLITEAFEKNLKGKGIPKIEDIKVGKTMEVLLKGNNFIINPEGAREQPIVIQEPTFWEWEVTPLKSGPQKLDLTVSVVLLDKRKTLPVFHKEFLVKINIPYSIKKFLSENWRYIISTIIGSGIIGWLWKRKFSKKGNRVSWSPRSNL